MKKNWLTSNTLGAILTVMAVMVMDAPAKARVFLLAGQSNMAGAGLYDQLEKAEQTPPEKVRIWHKNQWQELGPGISANKGRFGPELAFGRAIHQAFPDDDIYLIKTAAGGTSMHKHWTVDNGGGPMLKRFRATAQAALKDLEKRKVPYTIDGMLWMQGESDADQGKGAEYDASLRKFIKTMRSEFKQSGMPFIMGRIITTFDKPKGNGPLVRATQETIAREVKHVACFDTDDFPRINKGHYNHVGQIELGKAFAKHFLNMVKAAKP
ncbi:MAG: sialate O-acetylesterase [Verrucomicrobiales bacterium]|nr:sialate O-acetylesterase [Verrucomicrobiota bacterium JB025]